MLHHVRGEELFRERMQRRQEREGCHQPSDRERDGLPPSDTATDMLVPQESQSTRIQDSKNDEWHDDARLPVPRTQ